MESAFGRLKASQQDLQRQLNILNPKSEYLKEINSDLLQAETRITELTRRSNGLRDEMNDIIDCRPLTQSPNAKRKKREVVTWAAPENVFNQVNVHRLSALSRFDFAHGVDGSILEDGDLVYVVNHGILSIDYFHGKIPGHGPVAQMMDKGESDIFAYEMFSLRRSSSIVRAMTRLQRIWRRRRQQRVPVSIATNSSASNGAK